MAVHILDYYQLKAERLPLELGACAIYVRPGELRQYADPQDWELIGRTYHASTLEAVDVERQGFCLKLLPAGRMGGGLYARTVRGHDLVLVPGDSGDSPGSA